MNQLDQQPQTQEPEKKPRRMYTAGWITGGLALGAFGVRVIEVAPDTGSKIFGGLLAGLGLLTAGGIGGSYYLGDSDVSPHRLHLPQPTEIDTAGWEDPLAVEGLGVRADDIPDGSWPDTFDREANEGIIPPE
ncbi:MAG: hypothetical protein ABIQ89_01520 [Candidatus Saccharimonadales bacterium]